MSEVFALARRVHTNDPKHRCMQYVNSGHFHTSATPQSSYQFWWVFSMDYGIPPCCVCMQSGSDVFALVLYYHINDLKNHCMKYVM